MQGQQVGLQGLGTAMQGTQVGLQGVSGAQQGYQGAAQAGGTLGNIASQEAQARLAALALKNQMGQQQQTWPWQQLQYQQGMLSGLPISQQTTQGYQAPPNAMSRLAGIGSTVIGGYGLLNKSGALDGVKNWWNSSNNNVDNITTDQWMSGDFAKGGEVKSYASGGLVTLAINNALKG
jgi:hypothetical protein